MMNENAENAFKSFFNFEIGEKAFVVGRDENLPGLLKVVDATVIGYAAQFIDGKFVVGYIFENAEKQRSDILEGNLFKTKEEAEGKLADGMNEVRAKFDRQIADLKKQIEHLKKLKENVAIAVSGGPKPTGSEPVVLAAAASEDVNVKVEDDAQEVSSNAPEQDGN